MPEETHKVVYIVGGREQSERVRFEGVSCAAGARNDPYQSGSYKQELDTLPTAPSDPYDSAHDGKNRNFGYF